MHPSITLDRIGKRFRTWQPQATHNTLRDAVASTAAGLFDGRKARVRSRDSGAFWALRDVTAQVMPGETVGIIGPNGAGKSTLLKILAAITEPTEGRGVVRGRVGSLLEVGTGFHSELTGRENIYLSGAILGMARADIVRKFDEIVAFAEVEQFVDTPVKHYSSGMHLRLGFAVAAHLDSHILIVDEVLAVGDERFQRKCVAKMEDVSREAGRTVLFVSHNLAAVQGLCRRCLLLDRGRLVEDGPARTVVAGYLASLGGSMSTAGQVVDLVAAPRRGTGTARFAVVEYASDDERLAFQPYGDGPVSFQVTVVADRRMGMSSLSVTLHDSAGTILVNADTFELGWQTELREGENVIAIRIRSLHLRPGPYTVGLWLEDETGAPVDYIARAFGIHVLPRAGAARIQRGTGVQGTVSCEFEAARVENP